MAQTWGIFDAHEDPGDIERALFLGGFPTRAAALAQIPQLIADMAALGFDLSLDAGDVIIRPEEDLEEPLPDDWPGPWEGGDSSNPGPHDVIKP